MPSVETVTGQIDAGELGTTLIHEHLITTDEAVRKQWPQVETLGTIDEEPVPGDGLLDAAVKAAEAAVELEVKTIADPTAMFLGRDVEFMREVSERSGLQVVPCTGIYTYEYLPQFFLLRDADAMADLFVSDIEEGIQGTEIKAAFIKCAADEPGVTENIEKVHRAAARASVRTGAPIMAHSRPASETGAAPGRDLRGGGRRPLEGPDRPHRRHRRPRLHRAPARQGRLDRAGPLRARDLPARTRSAFRPC